MGAPSRVGIWLVYLFSFFFFFGGVKHFSLRGALPIGSFKVSKRVL
jgi:hypothetical protein